MKIEDVVIVGAGPAGVAAAVQLKRSGIEPLLFEKNRVGGLLNNANLVDNYPGFPAGISGTTLVALFEKHLERFGIEVHTEEVLAVEHDGHFAVTTSRRQLRARHLVVASGTKPRAVSGFAVPREAAGRVFHEVYPIRGVLGKKIAVIGAGDAAFDYSLNLARHNQVHILNRGRRRRCLDLLWEKASAESNIRYHENTSITSFRPADDGLALSCGSGRSVLELEVDYVIFATGRIENTDFLSPPLKDKAQVLSAAGKLHVIGDVKNGVFRQSSIAIGEGVSAAMRIYHRLKGNDS